MKSWVDKFADERRSFAVGDQLSRLTRKIGQGRIDRYAEASGDRNPIHIDPAFAATTQFGGTIAHGMLLLGILSYMLTVNFGRAWVESGRLKIRFRAPARPGDALTATGTVKKVEASRTVCDVECRSSSGEVIVDGTAEVTLP